nr:MAG TPA: hypothetical protein [Caudoviricetes sp.]
MNIEPVSVFHVIVNTFFIFLLVISFFVSGL